jgi:hypothetical protein
MPSTDGTRKPTTWAWRAALLLIAVALTFAPAAVASWDREDDVDGFRLDVFVLVGTQLENPIGFCTSEPCGPGETLPSSPLFNLTGSSMGLTWGQFQQADADSKVRCLDDGSTDIRIKLTGLIPNSVYSIFYRTFGPDSVNRFCPNEERSIVVPGPCQSGDCPQPPNSEFTTDAKGRASYTGRVDVCLLDADTALLDVIYHLNGTTYGELPNQLESQTQLTPCVTSAECAVGDDCVEDVCQPTNCAAEGTCRVCHSSFGNDAMRQAVIIQKAP